MATQIAIMGRIDELENINTLAKLEEYLVECNDLGNVTYSNHPERNTPEYRAAEVAKQLAEHAPMYQPLGLMPGTYMVTGIEGPHYDGYVSGDPIGNDTPWPLEVTEGMSAFDIMVAVAASPANGYPDINHVWFETLTVDVMAMTLAFSMGS